MAMGWKHTCAQCGLSLSAWSDDNPFFMSDKGKRQFSSRPNEEEFYVPYR